MRAGICVGGLIEGTGQSVRLIPMGFWCNPSDTDFDVGEVWDLDLQPRANVTPPHVEDHDIIRPGTRVGNIEDMDSWLRTNIEPWTGDRTALFDGALEFRENGTAYVLERGRRPGSSTGFWVLPNDMVYSPFTRDNRDVVPYYRLLGTSPIKVKYVGVIPVEQLPERLAAGTLVRLSLAHIWTTSPNEEDRDKFFLQLSGWFD